MSRYIKADAARDVFEPLVMKVADAELTTAFIHTLILTSNVPSIDIVFCKECKHWDRAIDESGTIERFNFSRCTKGHYGDGLGFYCADGERREP